MKKHTPIKRHQALAAFSRDHHFGLLLVWKINYGLDHAVASERISNYLLYFFEKDLKSHFEEEEQMLFPKLPPNNILRRQAEREHAILNRLIEQIRKDRQNGNLLLQFAQILKDHIRFEERRLFAAIQDMTGDQGLATIVVHENSRGNEVDAGWNDLFWVAVKPACDSKRIIC